MKCAGGSSTNHYKFDPYNPCGETSDKCGAPGKMLVQIILWYDSYIDNINLSDLMQNACSFRFKLIKDYHIFQMLHVFK